MIQRCDSESDVKRYRTIWISDVHLGTKSSRPACLLDFLKHHESEELFVVGDLVDGWRLKRMWYWEQLHNDVIQKLLRKARKGTKVTYIPGNHDAFARDYVGHHFGGIAVERMAEHITADGKKLLVVHGDEFDNIVSYAKWLYVLGAGAHCLALLLNHVINGVRLTMGYPYWSVSTFFKNRLKNAAKYIEDFEVVASQESERLGYDGVVCGHIHQPSIQNDAVCLYFNTGDWVENCSALAERFDGSMELIFWDERMIVPETAPARRSCEPIIADFAPIPAR